MEIATIDQRANAAAGSRVNAPGVLVVRHGEGRGRPNPYLRLVLDRAARTAPDLASRIRVHGTGEGPADLSNVGAVWFFLADPLDREFPDCHAEAKAIAAQARASGANLINPPEALCPTSKTEQLALWAKAGIPCARAVQVGGADELEAAFDVIRFPVIFRSDLGHAQETALLCQSKAEARAYASRVRYPGALIEFIDVRQAWLRDAPHSLMARFHHKKRSMVFGPRVYNNHLFVSNDGICGLGASTFFGADRLRHRLTRPFNAAFRDSLAADIDYALEAPEHPELMARAVTALGLDVAAIDYSTFPDGSVVLWEANPYFYMHPAKEALLWKERRIPERNWRYDQAMVQMLAEAAS